MKHLRFLLVALLCLGFGVTDAQVYSPGSHSLTAKAMGFSQATPTDARSQFFDAINFVYRDYVSTTEVKSYLNLAKYRKGGFTIYINSTGTLLSSGVIVGGSREEWWFKDTTSDAGLVQKVSEGSSAAVEQTLTDGATITWNYSNGSYAKVTLGGNRTLSLTNATAPCSGILEVVQDGTGSRTLTLPGNSPVGYALSTGAGEHDLLGFVKNSTGTYWSVDNYGTVLTQLSTPALTATVIGNTEIDLGWTNVANESSYKLEWSPNGSSSWTQIGGTIAANTITYNHTGLTSATHYYYRVSAIGDGVTYSNSGYGTDDDVTTGTDVTAPILLSATVENATPTHVDLVFSEALNSTWSASSAFTVTGHTVSAITRVTSTTGYLTVDAFSASETRTLAYTQPGSNKMQDLAGNLLANISSQSITDNVGAGGGGVVALDFTGSTHIAALGTDGDDWQVSTGSGGYGNLGKATLHMPASTQCRIILDNISGAGSHASVLGLSTTNAEVGFGTMIAGLNIDKNTNTLFPVDGGVIGSGIALGGSKSVCLLREAGGAIKIQTATQVPGGPWTWTTVATLTASSAAALYVVGDMNATGGVFYNAYGEDLVP